MKYVLQQTWKNYLVYLIDNGSSNQEGEILAEEYGNHPQVKVIQHQENLGFTGANNKWMAHCMKTYPDLRYIALLNNDTEVATDWLEQLVRASEVHEAALVGSKMIHFTHRQQMDNAGHFMLNTAEVIPVGHMEPIAHFEQPIETVGPCAGACLYQVEMLRSIGLFDPYFTTGYEDAELGIRAMICGYKSIFAPKAICYHKVSASINKIRSYEYLRQIQLNIFYSYFKLMPSGVLWINLPSFLFKYGMIFLIDLLFFRWAFLRMMADAIYLTATRERSRITSSRSQFFKQHTPIASLTILKKQTFFLWFDIQRFYKYILLRKPTHFE